MFGGWTKGLSEDEIKKRIKDGTMEVKNYYVPSEDITYCETCERINDTEDGQFPCSHCTLHPTVEEEESIEDEELINKKELVEWIDNKIKWYQDNPVYADYNQIEERLLNEIKAHIFKEEDNDSI